MNSTIHRMDSIKGVKILNEDKLGLKYRPASTLPPLGDPVLIWHDGDIFGLGYDLAWLDADGVTWRRSDTLEKLDINVICWLPIVEPIIEGLNDE